LLLAAPALATTGGCCCSERRRALLLTAGIVAASGAGRCYFRRPSVLPAGDRCATGCWWPCCQREGMVLRKQTTELPSVASGWRRCCDGGLLMSCYLLGCLSLSARLNCQPIRVNPVPLLSADRAATHTIYLFYASTFTSATACLRECMRFISLGNLLQTKLSGTTLYTLAQLVPTPKASTFNRQMMNLGGKR
jgi:hypothetical protein